MTRPDRTPCRTDGHRPSSLRCEKCTRKTSVLAKIGDVWICPTCRSTAEVTDAVRTVLDEADAQWAQWARVGAPAPALTAELRRVLTEAEQPARNPSADEGSYRWSS